MKLEKLQWDSDFFNYSIGKIVVKKGEEILLKDLLKDHSFRLVYIFSSVALSKNILEETGVCLVDEKITLEKDVFDEIKMKPDKFSFNEIKKMDDDVIKIALESGGFSRYKTDKNFVNNEYQKLYFSWIEKSFSKEIADEVTGCYIEGKLAGLITLKKESESVEIGLLSVNADFRRRKIGSLLLDYANNYTFHHAEKKITVSTQAQNLAAMALYQKNNYKIFNRSFVYHSWKQQ